MAGGKGVGKLIIFLFFGNHEVIGTYGRNEVNLKRAGIANLFYEVIIISYYRGVQLIGNFNQKYIFIRNSCCVFQWKNFFFDLN